MAFSAVLLLAPGCLLSRDSDAKRSLSTDDETQFRNYGVVWPGKLTRSGIPASDSGWQWLRGEGVKSIVTFLSADDPDIDYAKFKFEHVLRIPLHPSDLPDEEQARQFLAFIQDPNNWPVHMHCHGGKDRTGMMAALARYAVDGWPLDKALAEARPYKGGRDLAGFRVKWLRKWAAHHEPGSERRPVAFPKAVSPPAPAR